MAELAKLITFEVAYQYWSELCGRPTRKEYMTQYLQKARR